MSRHFEATLGVRCLRLPAAIAARPLPLARELECAGLFR